MNDARASALALAMATALMAPSDALAEGSVKSSFVFAVNKGLTERCAVDTDINFALTHSAMNPREDIAKRDVIRALNACESKYAKPKHEALSLVSYEALAGPVCSGWENCTEDDKAVVAKTAFMTGARFIEDYAEVLLEELQTTCSLTQDYDCVEMAVAAANIVVDGRELDWLSLDEDGRVVAMARDGEVADHRAAMLAGLPHEVQVAHVALRNGSSVDEILDGDAYFKGESRPTDITELNGFLRFNFEFSPEECRSLLRKLPQFGATEVTIENVLLNGRRDTSNFCNGSGLRHAVLAYRDPAQQTQQ